MILKFVARMLSDEIKAVYDIFQKTFPSSFHLIYYHTNVYFDHVPFALWMVEWLECEYERFACICVAPFHPLYFTLPLTMPATLFGYMHCHITHRYIMK